MKAQLVDAAEKNEAHKRKADEDLEHETIKKAKLEHEELLAAVESRGLEVSGTTLDELRQAFEEYDQRILEEEERQELLGQVELRGLDAPGTTLSKLRHVVQLDEKRIQKKKARQQRAQRLIELEESRNRTWTSL